MYLNKSDTKMAKNQFVFKTNEKKMFRTKVKI